MNTTQLMNGIAANEGFRRDLRDHCTCPHCRMHWRTDGRVVRDFCRTIHCPTCFTASQANPNLTRLLFSDGRRLPLSEKGRGAR